MATKIETIVGIREARKITTDLQKDAAAVSKTLVSIGIRARKAMKRGVPAALEMTAREWMRYTFKESVAKVYRSISVSEKLKELPEGEICALSEGNAYELTRLPEKVRYEPKFLKAAKELPNDKFRKVVVAELTSRSIPEDEATEWLRFKWSVTLIESAHDMEKKVARALGIDIEAKPGTIQTVWEAVIQHINSLTDADIRANLGAGSIEAAS